MKNHFLLAAILSTSLPVLGQEFRGWWQKNSPESLEGMEAVGIVPPASREGRG